MTSLVKRDAEVSMKDPKVHIMEILEILEREYPEARIFLNWRTPLELLIATILAAQCTDERVNEVTKDLFKKYQSAEDFAAADIRTLEEEIRPTGFYRNKAKNIVSCCLVLVEKHRGEVPNSLDDLVSLPGVGRKTANIVLGNAYGQEAIAVDTHVGRVTSRMGLATSKDPDKIEEELREIIPQNKWTRSTHLFGFHGRRICQAKKPLCSSCVVRDFCKTGAVLLGI